MHVTYQILDSVIYTACAKDLCSVNGKYIADRKIIESSPVASSDAIARDVYSKSMKLIEEIKGS